MANFRKVRPSNLDFCCETIIILGGNYAQNVMSFCAFLHIQGLQIKKILAVLCNGINDISKLQVG